MGRFVQKGTSFIRKKLTKDEEYNHWITQTRRARNGRLLMERRWRRWYNIADDMLWGHHRLSDGSQAIQVNQLASILENVIPNISFRAGIVEIRSFSYEDAISAAIWEKVARWVVIKHNMADEFQSSIYNALVLGNGLIKIGHSLLPLLSEPQWNAGLANEQGARPVSVFGMDWPLFEFFPDFSADRWNRQRFFFHGFDMHIDEFADHPVFDSKQVKKVKPTRRTEDIFFASDPETESRKKDYVAVTEIHDLVNAEMMVIADKSGADSFLFKQPEPFNMIPVERLAFFNRPMSVWGKGITQTIEQHLVDLSKIDTYAMGVLKKEALIKIIVDAARWTKKNIAALENSQDSIIAMNGLQAGSFEVVDYHGASKNFTYERTRAMKMATIRELAGAGRMQQGLHEVGVGSATESALLQGNADVITQWRANKFSEFAARVIEKMLFIISVTYEPERIAKMVGIPNPESLVPFLQPYDPSKYVLKYGQAAVGDQADRREKFMAFIQLFGQVINPAIAVKVATEIFDLEYTDELTIPGMVLGGNQGAAGGQGGQQATTGFRPAESQQQAVPGG
jgi:hypothetical protein